MELKLISCPKTLDIMRYFDIREVFVKCNISSSINWDGNIIVHTIMWLFCLNPNGLTILSAVIK